MKWKLLALMMMIVVMLYLGMVSAIAGQQVQYDPCPEFQAAAAPPAAGHWVTVPGPLVQGPSQMQWVPDPQPQTMCVTNYPTANYATHGYATASLVNVKARVGFLQRRKAARALRGASVDVAVNSNVGVANYGPAYAPSYSTPSYTPSYAPSYAPLAPQADGVELHE